MNLLFGRSVFCTCMLLVAVPVFLLVLMASVAVPVNGSDAINYAAEMGSVKTQLEYINKNIEKLGAEQERLSARVEKLYDITVENKVAVSTLKAKASTWGVIGGALVSAVFGSGFIVYTKHENGNGKKRRTTAS